MKKCQIKMFSHLQPIMGVLNLNWKYWKPIKFPRYSSSCIFSSDKISRWQYFIVSPNYVQENEKMLKNDIFQSFWFIFCSLENIRGHTEKPPKFQQLFFTENNWIWYCQYKICKCKIEISKYQKW